MVIRLPALLALLCLLSSPASAYQGEILPIEPRKYYETLKREIDNARSSITVCVYLFSLSASDPNSPAQNLAQALVQAKRRGVGVEVILDQNIDFVKGFARSLEGKNMNAYEFLQSNGISVFFDGTGTYTHSKAAIFDGGTVVLGSGNWTDSSFNVNMETNVLLRSREAAREFLSQLARIPRQKIPDQGPVIRFPLQFLTGKEYLGGINSNRLALALDVYALLLRKQQEQNSSEMDLDYAAAAQTLGFSGPAMKNAVRNISWSIRRLEDPLKVLERLDRHEDRARLRLKSVPGETIPVPETFWTWGWHHRLDQAAKELYFLGLHYSRLSSNRPRWSRSIENLAADLHYDPATMDYAVTKLRRANLFEVRYDEFSFEDRSRRPSIYTTNMFYDPAELEKAFAALSASHGPEKLARARRWASLVYEDSDLSGVKALLDLETRYGKGSIEKASQVVAQKHGGNPKRNMGYLIGTIERMNGNNPKDVPTDPSMPEDSAK